MNKKKPLPNRNLLLERFIYEPDTGNLIYKIRGYGITLGAIAGRTVRDGRIQVRVNKEFFYASRIIWLMVTSEEPGDMEIDHIDRDTSNNKWNNLRKVTHRENMKFRRKHDDSNQLELALSFT